MNKQILFLVVLLFTPIFFAHVSAETVYITKSEFKDHIIFDGKWSFEKEWKPTSLTQFTYDQYFFMRSAHGGEFIYIMIDVTMDQTNNAISFFDNTADKSMICFDSQNNKSQIPDDNDYCFIATLGSDKGITLQGDPSNITKNYFKEIQNHEDFIAIGAMSDETDYYSKVSHAGYEFRIPIEIFGRSDNYGFLAYVYDDDKKLVTAWPESIEIDDSNNIPSPSEWGDMVSPDKTLPEFGVPMVLFSLGIISTIVLLALKNPLRYQFRT